MAVNRSRGLHTSKTNGVTGGVAAGGGGVGHAANKLLVQHGDVTMVEDSSIFLCKIDPESDHELLTMSNLSSGSRFMLCLS